MALKESGERKSVSVIEIVNDDMPFLVDSVMGEIAERRLNVQLVVHPVFGAVSYTHLVVDVGWGDVIWDCHYRSVEECRPNVIAGNRGFCNHNPAGPGWQRQGTEPPKRHRKRRINRD